MDMSSIQAQEERDGVRLSWNVWPSSSLGSGAPSSRSGLYIALKPIGNPPPCVRPDPCTVRRSTQPLLSTRFQNQAVDVRSASEGTISALRRTSRRQIYRLELIPQFTTVEYELNNDQWVLRVFICGRPCLPESELESSRTPSNKR